MSQSEISPCLACGEPSANTVLCDECLGHPEPEWVAPEFEPCLFCRKSTDNGMLCERCDAAFDMQYDELAQMFQVELARRAGHTRINGPYDDYACKECTEKLIREYIGNLQPEDEPVYVEWHF